MSSTTAVNRGSAGQEGAALILTLLVLAILVVLVVQLTYTAKVEERVVRNAQDDAALAMAARGVGPLLTALFQDDQQNGEPAGDLDTLGDIMFDPNAAEERRFAIGPVTLTLRIEDLERRFPLTWLADEARSELAVLALKRLIEKLQPVEGDPESFAQDIASRVQSLRGGDDPGPAAAGPGAAGPDPGRRWLFGLDELLDGGAMSDLGDGFPGGPAPAPSGEAARDPLRLLLYGDPDADPPTQGLAPFVTAWPIGAVNLNTVLPEVLYALLPEKDKADEPTDLWPIADDLVEAIRTRRIDPEHAGDGGGADSAAGGQGASRSWPGQAFTEVSELQDATIHEQLKAVFRKEGSDEGGGGGGAGGAPGTGTPGGTPAPTGDGSAAGEGEGFSFEQALGVRSRFYAVHVTASLPDGVEAIYRLVVHRSDQGRASVLSFAEAPPAVEVPR